MDCKKRRHFTYDLKNEIIQKVKDGITRSDIQKEYGISSGTLSKWVCSPDKIIAKANGESLRHRPIQPISEENIDDDLKCEIVKKVLTGVNMSKIQEDHNIDEETLSKCYRKWFTPDDKIVAKVMGEIQTVPEENIDEDDTIVHEEDEDNDNDDDRGEDDNDGDDDDEDDEDGDDDGDEDDDDDDDDDEDDDDDDGDDDGDDVDDDDDDNDDDDDEDGDDVDNDDDNDDDDGDGDDDGDDDDEGDIDTEKNGLSQYEINVEKKRKKKTARN